MANSDDDADRRRAERLLEALREVETLAVAVAHDFELPLGAIARKAIAIGKTLQKPDADTAEALQGIRDCVTVMQTMIGNLGELGALAGEPLQLEPVDMAALARKAWAGIENKESVALSVGDLPMTRGHPRMLALVWKNLLSGAASRSAGNEWPRVEVGGGGSGATVVYSVGDNGTGLDLNYTGKLLNAFEQIQKQSEHPGMAVELAVVQRIVTRHRGEVWVEASRNKGALILFSLPIASPTAST